MSVMSRLGILFASVSFVFSGMGLLSADDYGYMKCSEGFDPVDFVEEAERLPEYVVPPSYEPSSGQVSLLKYMTYDAVQRDQGHTGTCWMWATQAVMSIQYGSTLEVLPENGFSVQFLASYGWMVDVSLFSGGSAETAQVFYEGMGYNIPWSNVNAAWTDGDGVNRTSPAWIHASPRNPIADIDLSVLDMSGKSQDQCVRELKSLLDNGQAVWFSYTLCDKDDWEKFFVFWGQGSPEDICDPAAISGGGTLEMENGGGSHAVCLVGYDDSDENNPYWLVLNSWGIGDDDQRVDGTFRMNMNTDYQAIYYSGMIEYPLYQWRSFDTSFADEVDKKTRGVNLKANNNRENGDNFIVTQAEFPADQAPESIHHAMLYIDDDDSLIFQLNDENGEWKTTKSGFQYHSNRDCECNLRLDINTKTNSWTLKLQKTDLARRVDLNRGLLFYLRCYTSESSSMILGRKHAYAFDDLVIGESMKSK